MTPEERIAALEVQADRALKNAGMTSRSYENRSVNAQLALALEVRALRLTLREEIREAAWAGKAASAPVWADGIATGDGAGEALPRIDAEGIPLDAEKGKVDPIASRKAPPA